MQKNEGKWDFELRESGDGRALVLDVAVGRHLATELVLPDVQPRCVRLLIKAGSQQPAMLGCERLQTNISRLRLYQAAANMPGVTGGWPSRTRCLLALDCWCAKGSRSCQG